ncbi:MAG: CotH kinase family protein [Solirubrobacterales bacterium]
MSLLRSRAVGAGALFVIAAVLAVVPAAACADEAEPLYKTNAVAVVDLTLSPAARSALEAEPDEYVEAGFELGIDDDGVPGGHVTELTASPLTVGLRLKGSVLGSFRPLSGKAALKVKFAAFVKKQKFRGLKKLTLNNMVEDPSMIHEALTYTVFRQLGIPAPRTGYAFVRLNGEPYGVYMDIEDVDDVALKRIFGSFDEKSQHLYEGENGADVVPGGAGAFEVDEGEEANRSDLEALIAAVNGPSPASFAARLAPVADLAEMTRFWAIEKYIGRWDGYAGADKGANQPNNYLLYSNSAGVFQMLPWGSDETWEQRLAFDGHDGLMFNLCLEDPACAAPYWEALHGARSAIAALPLDALATELAALLAPWQAEDPRKEQSQAQIEAAVAGVRQFIASRPAEADAWLAAHEPPPKGGDAGGGASGGGSDPGGTAAPQDARPLRLAGVVKRPGELRLRFRLLVPGRVRESVSVGTAAGRRRVCAPAASAAAATTLVLTCRLPRFVRQRLRRGPVRLRVVTEVETASGVAVTATRRVTLPRQ